jgi:hypothetical protein
MKSNQYFTSIKTLLLTFFIGVSLSFYANNNIPTKSYFDHLSEVNKEWNHHKDAVPEGLISFNSDLDRIQLHLSLVIEHLKTNSPSYLNSDQISNRLTLLDKLQEYANNKVFPINKYHSIRTPYFVDHLGTNCAVGQMIYVSGNEELVAKISKEHNYDYIKDIRTEGVVEWANEFGFTLDELKWIQPAYPPTQTMDQVLDGTNGKVNKILRHYSGEKLTIAGEFTELDGSPCLNIGFYENNQLSCYGNGIDGQVDDVIERGGTVYAFGKFNNNGDFYSIAKYDSSSWSYIEIPNREGATITAVNKGNGGSGYFFEVALSHNSIPNHQETWRLLGTNTWEKQLLVNGVIKDIILCNYGKVHVGNFDSVTVYNSNATIDTTLTVNNVVIKSYYPNVWYGIEGEISETVNVVKQIGNALIFGGTCSVSSWGNDVCISKYFNSVLQPLYLNDHLVQEFSVNTIAYNGGDKFTFGGEFYIEIGFSTYGDNLATFDLVNNNAVAIAVLDKPVNSIAFINDDLYVGGDFQDNMGSAVNYLGRITSTVGLSENKAEINLNVYPNPFNSIINLEGIEDGANYSILYIDGRVAKSGTVQNEKINELDFLPKGSYLLQLESMKGNIIRKIFK